MAKIQKTESSSSLESNTFADSEVKMRDSDDALFVDLDDGSTRTYFADENIALSDYDDYINNKEITVHVEKPGIKEKEVSDNKKSTKKKRRKNKKKCKKHQKNITLEQQGNNKEITADVEKSSFEPGLQEKELSDHKKSTKKKRKKNKKKARGTKKNIITLDEQESLDPSHPGPSGCTNKSQPEILPSVSDLIESSEERAQDILDRHVSRAQKYPCSSPDPSRPGPSGCTNKSQPEILSSLSDLIESSEESDQDILDRHVSRVFGDIGQTPVSPFSVMGNPKQKKCPDRMSKVLRQGIQKAIEELLQEKNVRKKYSQLLIT